MKQSEFANLKVGDKVFTIHKGQVVNLEIKSIYNHEKQKKSVILTDLDGKDLLKHMYAIYNTEDAYVKNYDTVEQE